MANLLDKTRKITSILQRSVDSLEGDLPYNNMAAQLADIIDCNAAIVNGGGALLGFAMKYKTNNDRVEKFFKAKQLPEEYIRGISSFIIWRNDHDFVDDDLILVEIASTVVGLQLLHLQTENLEETIRKQTAINMAINTLSYSEIKAVSAILNELDGLEGRLTASVIADRIGITRSVIVNALRKLESAGIIESRSLGMKGTYLKVLNEGIYDKLKEYE